MRNDAPLKLSDYMTPKPYLRTAMLEPEGLDVFSVDENFDAAELSSRPWHIHGLAMLGHLSLILSPGGVGKSTLGMTIGVGSALGRHQIIPGYSGVRSGNALILNTEEDEDEMKRRLAGVLQRHKITAAQLKGKLFLKSLFGDNAALGQYNEGLYCLTETRFFEKLVAFCKEQQIDLIVLDPLIGFHNEEENSNGIMEEVATLLRRLARETGAAVLVIHHTRKGSGGNDTEAHAGDMDAGRGASALVAAARIAITLARMSKKTAKEEGIDWALARNLRRIDDAKMNYAPSSEEAKWFELRSTKIANGESVPVPMPFNMDAVAERKAAQEAAKDLKRIPDLMEEIAVCFIGDLPEGAEKQPDIVAKLQVALEVGRSTALDRLRLIPIGEQQAHKMKDGTHIWREKTGQTYTVHWRTPK